MTCWKGSYRNCPLNWLDPSGGRFLSLSPATVAGQIVCWHKPECRGWITAEQGGGVHAAPVQALSCAIVCRARAAPTRHETGRDVRRAIVSAIGTVQIPYTCDPTRSLARSFTN
eukprot:6179804-Pleurochrysis_carterae.AAC.1